MQRKLFVKWVFFVSEHFDITVADAHSSNQQEKNLVIGSVIFATTSWVNIVRVWLAGTWSRFTCVEEDRSCNPKTVTKAKDTAEDRILLFHFGSVATTDWYTRRRYDTNPQKLDLDTTSDQLRSLACISFHRWVLLHFTTSYSGALHHTTVLFNREITLEANSIKFCLVIHIFLKLFLKVIL